MSFSFAAAFGAQLTVSFLQLILVLLCGFSVSAYLQAKLYKKVFERLEAVSRTVPETEGRSEMGLLRLHGSRGKGIPAGLYLAITRCAWPG